MEFYKWFLETFNSLPNDKILDHNEKIVDDKINFTQILMFVLEKVENIAGKGENAGYQHFLLFPQCYNPSLNKPWFLRVCYTSLLKTLREKEKLLITSNFSFSHSVFYPFGELSAIFNKLA